MKRTLIHGAIACLATSLLAGCGGSTDSSASGNQLLATTAACYAAWNSTTAYNGGAQVSYAGVNYTAAYWTQGQNPSTNNGPSGSGQPWISNGTCGGSPTPAPTPTPTPAPTPTPTPAPTPTPTPAPPPSCSPTAITPYISVNGGTWQQTSSVTVSSSSSVRFGPQPTTGGSWSWTGCGTSGTSRQQTVTIDGSCTAKATYTNSCGAKTTQSHNVTISGFRHPGVLVNRAQLDFVKSKIAASAQPWKAAYDEVLADPVSSLTYTATPWQTVECGSSSNPNYGCSDERADAQAAYTDALLWYFTGNSAYAKKSIEIMNAWSNTLTGGHTNSNATLQAAWASEVWPRAAEIIRYTYTGWAQTDIDRFKNMLTTQYLPDIDNGAPCKNGNWETSTIEAMMNIAVFKDDKALFDKAVGMWRKRTPAYFYLKTDGTYPVQPPNCSKTTSELISYWQGQSTFVDGLAQETCRDFGHTAFGFSGIVNAAETARIQGVDLYAEAATRLTKAMEFHALYQNGTSAPSWLCGGSPNLGFGGTLEIAYNHYHNRLGISLPQTLQLIEHQRPEGRNYHRVWETLTHAEVGSVGIN